MNRRGFTVVELIITITVMGILLVLAFVNMTASQVRARDEERRTDVESISQHLESYYRNGSGEAGELLGRYPAVASPINIDSKLRNIDPKSLKAPGVDDFEETFKYATNINETPTGVLPQPTIGQYVYQPLAWDGTAWQLCSGSMECRKYNLYYRLENNNVVQKVMSKNQ